MASSSTMKNSGANRIASNGAASSASATLNYRKLLSNLPSMASVVNSFESAEVQLEVYKTLIQALNSGEQSSLGESKSAGSVDSNGVVAHDIVEGGNIHAVDDDD